MTAIRLLAIIMAVSLVLLTTACEPMSQSGSPPPPALPTVTTGPVPESEIGEVEEWDRVASAVVLLEYVEQNLAVGEKQFVPFAKSVHTLQPIVDKYQAVFDELQIESPLEWLREVLVIAPGAEPDSFRMSVDVRPRLWGFVLLGKWLEQTSEAVYEYNKETRQNRDSDVRDWQHAGASGRLQFRILVAPTELVDIVATQDQLDEYQALRKACPALPRLFGAVERRYSLGEEVSGDERSGEGTEK